MALTREVRFARPSGTEGLPDESLQEVNRLWTIVRTFSTAAHDVNNALQIIAGTAELLEDQEAEPSVKRRVETIRIQAARAAATLERLVLYARDAPEHCRAVDLAPLVESGLAMRAFAFGRAGIAISVERSDAEPYWATGDRNRLLQAVLNVLLAAEAAIKPRRAPRIDVRLSRERRRVIVSVIASGEHGREEETSALADSRAQMVDAVTMDTELWSAAHVAAAAQGTLDVQAVERQVILTLSFQSEVSADT